MLGKPHKSLECLRKSLEISNDIKEHSGDVLILGDVGDIYEELGDFKRATIVSILSLITI